MSTKSKKLTPEELERRQIERERRKSVPRLLYTREQTGEALGVSVSTVIRLENEKKLSRIRLRGATGQVFNPVAEVEALASSKEAR